MRPIHNAEKVDVEMFVHEWHNGRERGYVIHARRGMQRQLNIAFYEHRNSDDIYALMWEQVSLNPIMTYEAADFGGKFEDKYSHSHSVRFGMASDMAGWIHGQLEDFVEAIMPDKVA
jgi:hypothetical protein